MLSLPARPFLDCVYSLHFIVLAAIVLEQTAISNGAVQLWRNIATSVQLTLINTGDDFPTKQKLILLSANPCDWST